MIPRGVDFGDIRPVGNVALSVIVKACGNNGSVFFQSDGLLIGGAYGNDIGPVGNIALAALVISYGKNSAVCPQSYGMGIACGDIYNVIPIGYFTLSVKIPAGGCHSAVFSQANAVVHTDAQIQEDKDSRLSISMPV